MASPTFITSAISPRDEFSQEEGSLDSAFVQGEPAHAGEAGSADAPLPAGWRRLVTGLRGTRLYRICRPGRSVVYWEAAMKLDGKLLHRRFAAEIHARAWLSVLVEPRSSGAPFDLEEIHGPYRTAGVRGETRLPF